VDGFIRIGVVRVNAVFAKGIPVVGGYNNGGII
jgi:hypothetical protein